MYQAIYVDNLDFDEVLISPAMIQDHMPDTVLAALNKVSFRSDNRLPSEITIKKIIFFSKKIFVSQKYVAKTKNIQFCVSFEINFSFFLLFSVNLINFFDLSFVSNGNENNYNPKQSRSLTFI